jgi:uncharacterized repeat protein (TIGR01451 family)
VWTEQAKLVGSDTALDDQFGFSVAIDGNTAVVGANADDDLRSTSGTAFVFVRTGTAWSEQAKLTASDGAASDNFGWSVAIDAETVVVGANFDDDGTSASGSAYVFLRTGTNWNEQAKLSASDPTTFARFGESAAIDGETAVIGSLGAQNVGVDTGAAYVFVRTGSSWNQQAKLLASDGASSDFFGKAVSLSGESVLIGASGDDDSAATSGSAYVFIRTGGTSWSEQDKLTASDPDVSDLFGNSVALEGDTAVVGAHRSDDAGADTGSAYVFSRSAGSWTQQNKLLASDASAGARFGYAAAIDGGTVLIGAEAENNDQGSAYVFVPLRADLAITKTASPVEARVGQTLTYTITVTNNGPATATTISAVDTLPGSATFVSAPGCTGTTTVTCTHASLASEASVVFTITVTAPNVTGSISNTASVSAASPADSNSSNDSVTLVTSVLGFPPVPAIGTWALGTLALAFGTVVFIARRRRATLAN